MQPYRRLDGLAWTAAEQQRGKVSKIKGFSAQHKVKSIPNWKAANVARPEVSAATSAAIESGIVS